MRKNTLLFILVVILGFALSIGAANAQSAAIESQADYQHIKESINAVSQKLYAYAKQYPAYDFSAEYNAEGKVIAMNVSGVSSNEDAKQISTYLLELENLGELVRNMDANHLPDTKGKSSDGMLTENEAKQYVPIFNSGEPVSSTKRK
jgi:hypothetical protein